MNFARLFNSLSFVTRFVRRFGSLTPFGSLVSPILAPLAELVADGVRAFFNGLAIVFRNPTVILVVLAAMGYGYASGGAGSKDEIAALKTQVAQLQRVKRCTPQKVTSPPSLWDSIVR